MKTKRMNKLGTMLLIGVLAVMAPQWAMALTPACTVIGNTATLAYKVGSVDQTDITAAVNFTVANKINHTVTSLDAAAVTVVPGATSQALSFRVTNTGNANQTYVLTFTTLDGDVVFTETDNFDATTPGIGALSTATITTGIIAPLATVDTTIVATIPLARVDGDAAAYGLVATAYKVDGATIEAEGSASVTSGAGTCTTDIVFADDDGIEEGLEDGVSSVRGVYAVGTANLTFTKESTVIWDPINEATSPKAIPGALVRYDITLANANGAAPAILTTITDTLIGTLLMDADLKSDLSTPATPAAEDANGNGFKVLLTGGTRAGAAGSPLASDVAEYYTTADDADGVELNGQAITFTAATLLPAEAGPGYTAGELKGNESIKITFNVYVQ